MESPSRPSSWIHRPSSSQDFDPYHDLYTSALSGTPPVPGSPTFNENQSMLANMASPPTRPSGESQKSDSSSSSSNAGPAQPRSYSPNSYSSTSGNSQDTPLEAGPSHLPYRKPRTLSTRSMTSSPLNPATQLANQTSPFAGSFPRPVSEFMRMPSEESRALAGKGSLGKLTDGSATPNRASMILYRYANEDGLLLPPTMPAASNRDSVASVSSFASLSSDSKYPMGSMNSERGLIAYAYDPELDEREPADDTDRLHDPFTPDEKLRVGGYSWRGTLNIGTLVLLVLGLLALFVCFPVYSFYRDDGTNALIVGNTRINATGQANDS